MAITFGKKSDPVAVKKRLGPSMNGSGKTKPKPSSKLVIKKGKAVVKATF